MDEKIIYDLEQNIVKLFSKKEHALYNGYLENCRLPDELFVSILKVSTLIFGRPDFEHFISQKTPRVDINAPVLHGFFPLHLAVMTSSRKLVRHLIVLYGAKLDVKCCSDDPHSPFYALTPLELALLLISDLVPWTPQLSVHQLLCIFQDNLKVKLLTKNISVLLNRTPSVRYLVADYALQGNVVVVAALFKGAFSSPINVATMYIPTTNIPPELHFGAPMMLRLLLASKSASLIKQSIQISASMNPKEHDNCKRKIKEMDSIRTLLELAERGHLTAFDRKQQLTVKLTDDSSEGSQAEFKVNTVAPKYLNNSVFYIEPSKFQPHGAFNLLMPRGNKDRLNCYDGLDIRNFNDLTETIFRVLDGKKVDQLNLEDTHIFRIKLSFYLKYKFEEAETLTALEKQVMEQRSNPRLSSSRSLTMNANKISSLVFSAIKKGKA